MIHQNFHACIFRHILQSCERASSDDTFICKGAHSPFCFYTAADFRRQSISKRCKIIFLHQFTLRFLRHQKNTTSRSGFFGFHTKSGGGKCTDSSVMQPSSALLIAVGKWLFLHHFFLKLWIFLSAFPHIRCSIRSFMKSHAKSICHPFLRIAIFLYKKLPLFRQLPRHFSRIFHRGSI